MARKRGITLEEVVEAASRLSDTVGWAGVTLADVARELEIRSPSLYAHVDGLDGLRRALALEGARRMGSALRAAVGETQGVDALRAICAEYRSFAHAHPGLYEAVQRAVSPGEDDELYAALGSVVTPVVVALGEAGVGSGDRIHLARALRAALHGFVSLESGGGFGRPESVEESFERVVELLMVGVAGVGQVSGPGPVPEAGPPQG